MSPSARPPRTAGRPRIWPRSPPAAGSTRRTPFSTRIRITGPSSFTLNSVGTKIEDTEKEGRRTVVWVSEHQVDRIARFNPSTEEWVEFPLPEAESDPRRIDIDPTNPNRIYFSGNTPGRMGFVEVLAQ